MSPRPYLLPIMIVLLVCMITTQNSEAILIAGPVNSEPVFTQLKTDKNSYEYGDSIFISGHIKNHFEDYPVLINVNVPYGNSLPSITVPVDNNGDFNTKIMAGGPKWIVHGNYTLHAMHVSGSFIANTVFEYAPSLLAINITQNSFITNNKQSYNYAEPILISGNIGQLHLPITIEVQCDILATPSTYILFSDFGLGTDQVKPDGSFEHELDQINCNYQTSPVTARIQGTNLSTSFKMIGKESQPSSKTQPSTSIVSFDYELTHPLYKKFPTGRLYGQTSQANVGLFIIIRDPNGIKMWTSTIISDSQRNFDFRFDIGNPTVLSKQGNYTAIAYLYNDKEENGLQVKFENSFQKEPVVTAKPSHKLIQVAKSISKPAPELTILICHTSEESPTIHTTIPIRQSQWPEHQQNGDTLGECPTQPKIEYDTSADLQKIISENTTTQEPETMLESANVTVSHVDFQTSNVILKDNSTEQKPKAIETMMPSNDNSISSKTMKPLSIWSDSSSYVDGSTIHVEGKAKDNLPYNMVRVRVYSPSNYNIADEYVPVSDDGSFKIDFQTAGKLWFENGDYIIKVNDKQRNDQDMIKIKIEEPQGEFLAAAQEDPNPSNSSATDNEKLDELIQENQRLREQLNQKTDYLGEIIKSLQGFFDIFS